MCNITLTRRRGSRPDGARLHCKMFTQYGERSPSYTTKRRAWGTVGSVCATTSILHSQQLYIIYIIILYYIEVTQTHLSFIVSPLPIAHSAIIASFKMTPFK